MQLKTLVAAIPVRQVIGPLDRTVESIAYDSRRVQRNGLFVALRGEKIDGHRFHRTGHRKRRVRDCCRARRKTSARHLSRRGRNSAALADLGGGFLRIFPRRKLKMAAVTGTNGKTTTTFLIKHICEKAGMRCGLIGTVRYEIGERVLPAARTTPESLDLQELLAQMANAGCRAAAMEVSSHALAQERTRGLEWNVAVFTNLTQDHLDFHGTMENYFEAKVKLFTRLAEQKKKQKPVAIVNIDDRYGEQLLGKIDQRVSVRDLSAWESDADFRASNYRMEFGGTSYQLDARGKSYLVRVPLIGRFNVANSACRPGRGQRARRRVARSGLEPCQIAAGSGATGDSAGETAVSNFCRLCAHARRVAQCSEDVARTGAQPPDCRFWLRRRPRPPKTAADGRGCGPACGFRHHHFRQSAQGGSGRNHRRS